MSSETRERVRLHYSGNARAYDMSREQDERGSMLSEHDIALFQDLLPAFRSGQRILEVGAGTGRFTIPALRAGYSTISTDVNRGMLARLEEKLHHIGQTSACAVQTADVFHLPFEGGTFDGVFGIHLIPRFTTASDQLHAFLEIGRVLRPGGFVPW